MALQFSFYGTVHACCQNGRYVIGDVRWQSLDEIWNSSARRLMAEALAEGTYPPGCEHCGVEHALGNRLSTPAQAFDRFPDGMADWPRQMEFTLSSRCNLACIHCNGDNSSTIRSREGRPPMEMPYGEQFFAQIPPYLDRVEVVAFLGGEPFLAPEARRIWDMLLDRGLLPEVQVTTNATVWNDRVERYTNGLQMHFAVSIDGATKETYEAIRDGATYEKVIANRDRMLAVARRYGTYFQLNYCLLRANWHELGLFLRQADEIDVPANIIPVFQPSDHSLFSLSPDELAPIVDAWEVEARTLRPSLGRNGPVWDTTVAMVQGQLERLRHDWDRKGEVSHIRDEQLARIDVADDSAEALRQFRNRWSGEADEVLLSFPTRLVEQTDDAVARAEADLREWSGRDCLEITGEDGIITTVRAPEWVAPLGAQEWVGRPFATLSELLSTVLGPIEHGAPTQLGNGLVQWDPVIASPGGTVRLRAVWVEGVDRVLLATPDPLGAVG